MQLGGIFFCGRRAGESAEGLEGEGGGRKPAAFPQLPRSSPSCPDGSWERAPCTRMAILA